MLMALYLPLSMRWKMNPIKNDAGKYMVKKQESTKTVKNNEVVASQQLTNILLQEYTNLVSLYTHSENTLFSIFNFYVTLLTTIAGAVIVIFQLGGTDAGNPFTIVLLLLVFIVLIGIITQDALVNKNGDLAHFALALNAVKLYVFRNYPDVHASIFYMWDLHTRVNPLEYQITLDERLDKYLWWMLPIGMQQLFVSLMNSFALTAIVIVITFIYGQPQVGLLRLTITLILVIVSSYIAHCAYANIKFRQKVRRSSIAMGGQVQEWIEK